MMVHGLDGGTIRHVTRGKLHIDSDSGALVGEVFAVGVAEFIIRKSWTWQVGLQHLDF